MSDKFFFSFNTIFVFFPLDTIRYLGLRNDLFFRDLLLDSLFLWDFFDDLFFGHFFDELFLNKGGERLGLLNFQKCVFVALRYDFFGGKKNQKISQFFSIDDTRY